MKKSQNATFEPGKVLDNKWIIIELIGKGAMGEVYRAHQINLKRDVAIKTISDDVMVEIEDDPDEIEVAFGRFQREVQTMAQVRHTNILTIFDYGEVEEITSSETSRIAYIVMEYIPGNSLRFTLSEDGLDDIPEVYGKWIRNYFMPILDGVEILHNNKIIHRDLKPENVFMDGVVPKIADFGLARSVQMKAVTISIEMLGTLAYMSPEQCSDFKTADYTTDIYALGKILFEAVHGTLTEKVVPFTSVAIDNPQTDFLEEMSLIIQKATAEEPGARYQTIQELRGDLKKALLLFEGDNDQTDEIRAVTKSPVNSVSSPILWLIVGVVVAIISVFSMGVYHLVEKKESLVDLDESPYIDHADLPTAQQIYSSENITLEQSIIGRDGSRMILTGKIEDKKDDLFLFYMDEQKISNFLFVDFLNTLREKLTVKNGVVRDGETIIIYIGDGSAEEDVIISKHGRFHLKDQKKGVNPVVRVTYHGAHMFAATYGKELLTDKEWWFAYRYHSDNTATLDEKALLPVATDASNMMHRNISPQSKGVGDKTVLDGMGKNLKEWVKITHDPINGQTTHAGDGVYESGILTTLMLDSNATPLKRFPWEGFDDVAFRTKIRVRK
jgi:serine/threonine protein kinase